MYFSSSDLQLITTYIDFIFVRNMAPLSKLKLFVVFLAILLILMSSMIVSVAQSNFKLGMFLFN
jgi:hypothetical protein